MNSVIAEGRYTAPSGCKDDSIALFDHSEDFENR
jgi:hypothetical protein